MLADLNKDGAMALLESDEVAPVYLYWAPDGQRLSALVQRGNVLELVLLDVASPGRATHLADNPQALYWSWSRDGRTLALHLGSDTRTGQDARLSLLHLESNGPREEVLADVPGDFRAPAWSNNGQLLAYVGRGGGTNILTVRDASGQLARITATRGAFAFEWAPDSDWLAYSAATPGGAPIYQGLDVVRADASERGRLTDDALVAFFWAPDGKRVAYVGLDTDSRTLYWAAVNRDGTGRQRSADFLPSDDLGFQLAFFDQYAQSAQLWSPDGRRLVYATSDAQVRRNGSASGDRIQVQAMDTQAAPVFIGAGTAAVWSPRR
jgi:TolB protein